MADRIMLAPRTLRSKTWQFSKEEEERIADHALIMSYHGFDQDYPLHVVRLFVNYDKDDGGEWRLFLRNAADRVRCEAAFRSNIAEIPVVPAPPDYGLFER